MAKQSKKQQNAQTAARLTKSILQAGKDALQPSPEILATAWAIVVMAAPRDDVLAALKAASNGSIGFDYGPVGLTLVRWITINRMARHGSDPLTLWSNRGVTQSVSPSVATPKADPVADAVKDAVPFTAMPAAAPAQPMTGGSVPPVAPSVAPAAPAQPAAQPSVAEPTFAPDVAVAAAEAPADVAPVDLHLCPAQIAHPEWDWRPASKVFGVKGVRGNVAVWPLQGDDAAHERTPDVDADYVWTRDHLQWAVFAAGELPAKGLWLWGNRGSGKTEFCRQFAARTGRPFFPITFTRVMEPSDFLGDMGAEAGSSVWQDGTMLQALKCNTPAVILLDEISYGQSSHISGPLNEIVHPNCSFNVPRTGLRIRFNKAHLFIAADNTNGTGDPSGMYVGANTMNRATMDRFSFFRRFTYMTKALEVRMLQNRTGADEATVLRVWTILDALRKKVDSGLLNDPPSTREAIALCSALRAGFDEKDAFECCFVGKYAEESQEEMRVTFTAAFAATPSPSVAE